MFSIWISGTGTDSDSSLFGFSVASDTMSNCTCFLVFFRIPLHVEAAGKATRARDLTGLKSSVVNDAGFFKMDLISASTGVILVVSECERLAGPDAPIPDTGLHRRLGGLTGDWSCVLVVFLVVVVGNVSEADPSSYHTEDELYRLVVFLPSNSRTCNYIRVQKYIVIIIIKYKILYWQHYYTTANKSLE